MPNMIVFRTVDQVILDKIIKEDIFTAFDITLETQRRLPQEQFLHQEIKQYIHDHMQGYVKQYEQVHSTQYSAWEYRPIVKVPVPAVQNVQVFNQPLSQTVIKQMCRKGILKRKRPTRVCIPKNVLESLGIIPGQTMVLFQEYSTNTPFLTVKSFWKSAFMRRIAPFGEYRVDKNNNVRIGVTTLEPLGIPRNSKINFRVEKGKIFLDKA